MTKRQPASTRGRQAEAQRNDVIVLDAARDVFTELGPGAPIDTVAERAGVGVGTLYRRYGSKDELLASLCVQAMRQAENVARSALDADDGWTGLETLVRGLVAMRAGALAGLAGAIPLTDEMSETAARGARLRSRIVSRAKREGTLRADVTPMDIAWLIEQLARRAPDSNTASQEDQARDRLLTIALDGLRAPGSTPLPGRPPTQAAYAQRWQGPD